MDRRRFFLMLGLIVALALAGRIAYIVSTTQHQVVPDSVAPSDGARRSFDELYYQDQAKQIAEGVWFKNTPLSGPQGEESAHHGPLTAVALAPIAWAGGGVLAMRVVVAVAGAMVVMFVGLAGLKVAGPHAGLTAAGLAGIYPNLWMNDGLLLSETFAALGTAATVFCAYRLLESPTWSRALAAGAAASSAMLSRSELVLLVPLLLIPVVLIGAAPLRTRIVNICVMLLAVGLIIGPWVAFNLVRFERPVLLSHGDGGVLAGANCDSTYSGPLLGFWNGFCGQSSESEASVRSAEQRALAASYVADNIERVPVVVAARVGRLWSVYRPMQTAHFAEAEGRPMWASRTGLAFLVLLTPLAMHGIRALRRREVPLVPLMAPMAIVTMNAAVFYGSTRFRVPAEPSIVILSGVALSGWLHGRQDR